jgi:hypothetical protein
LFLCFNWAPRHEGVLGSGGIAPHIHDLGTRWRWVVSFTPLPLYPQGNSPWYPLERRLGGPQSRSRRGGEEKNSQLLSGLEPPNTAWKVPYLNLGFFSVLNYEIQIHAMFLTDYSCRLETFFLRRNSTKALEHFTYYLYFTSSGMPRAMQLVVSYTIICNIWGQLRNVTHIGSSEKIRQECDIVL